MGIPHFRKPPYWWYLRSSCLAQDWLPRLHLCSTCWRQGGWHCRTLENVRWDGQVRHTFGGFHSHGGLQNGWFLLGKIPSTNGWFGGTPMTQETPHLEVSEVMGVPRNYPFLMKLGVHHVWKTQFETWFQGNILDQELCLVLLEFPIVVSAGLGKCLVVLEKTTHTYSLHPPTSQRETKLGLRRFHNFIDFYFDTVHLGKLQNHKNKNIFEHKHRSQCVCKTY